jgi:RNA polymerase sigma-70 factor (ECF subfamily)
MPPRQTAALILCDVLDFAISEAAGILNTTPAATKGLLQRARASAPPLQSMDASASDRDLARRFAAAYAQDDVDAVIGLLTDESWLAMPPASECYVGRAAIGAFLRASAAGRPGGRYELVETSAAGRAAFVCYLQKRARGLLVITPSADGGTVASVMRFLDDDVHRWFGVPDVLE